MVNPQIVTASSRKVEREREGGAEGGKGQIRVPKKKGRHPRSHGLG